MAVRRDGSAPIYTKVVGDAVVARASWPPTAVVIGVKGPDSRGLPRPVVIVDGETYLVENGVASIRGLAIGEHVATVAAVGWVAKLVRFEVTGPGAGQFEVRLRSDQR
jgi:hypothetical protein